MSTAKLQEEIHKLENEVEARICNIEKFSAETFENKYEIRTIRLWVNFLFKFMKKLK